VCARKALEGGSVTSPYVRRLRLARELLALREERGYSAEKLASVVAAPRQRISGNSST